MFCTAQQTKTKIETGNGWSAMCDEEKSWDKEDLTDWREKCDIEKDLLEGSRTRRG